MTPKHYLNGIKPMPSLAKLIKITLTGLTLALMTSSSSFASNEKDKPLIESEDPNTTTIHYHIKNLTNNTMKLSKPTKRQSNSSYPISEFDVPAKGRDEYAADFPKFFSSIAFSKATELTETFAYVSGNKECLFTASIEVRLEKQGDDVERVPHWSGNGKSTGAEAADCSTEILEVKNWYPNSMSIEFTME